MGKYFKFLSYETHDRKNLIGDWYVEQTPEVQAALDATLNALAGTRDWTATWQYKALTGKHDRLCELKFTVDKRKYRPVGFWIPCTSSFVIVLGCYKSGRAYHPYGAFDLALQYHKEFKDEGKGTCHEYFF